MSVYKINEQTVNIDELGEVTLEELLTQKKFGKIYITLGINELGANQDTTVYKFGEIIKTIRKLQPDSVIFIQGNIHVGAEKSNSDPVFKNSTINELNSRLAKFANNVDTVYLDPNPLFDDANGDLNAEYTGDNVHLYANHYIDWKAWLETKAVVSEEELAKIKQAEADAKKAEADKNNADNNTADNKDKQ